MKNIINNLIKSFFKNSQSLQNGKSINNNLSNLQKTINYTFNNESILRIALTHTSCYSKSDSKTVPLLEYERMEFLGDSVLGLVTAEELFNKYPKNSEGFLSKLKSQIVSENYLAVKATNIKLGNYIYFSEEEFRDKGYEKKSILSNMMESLICAVYLDGGIKEAKTFILNFIVKDYKKELTETQHINYKSKLQEYVQSKHKELPLYEVIATQGPDHKKYFSVNVAVKGQVIGSGKGMTKKNAQQEAAREGCKALGI